VTKTNSCDKILSVLLVTRCHTGGKRAERPEKRSQFLHWNGRTPARLGSMCRYRFLTPSGKPTAPHLSRAAFRIGDDRTGADWTLPRSPFGGSSCEVQPENRSVTLI
jgi:hypothetical protein